MKRLLVVILGSLIILSLVAEWTAHHERSHWWSKIPGFFIYFGFAGCVLLIVFSKKLGKSFLLKDEDYYDNK